MELKDQRRTTIDRFMQGKETPEFIVETAINIPEESDIIRRKYEVHVVRRRKKGGQRTIARMKHITEHRSFSFQKLPLDSKERKSREIGEI